jgi:Family of unknown function (DUF6152)
MGESVANHPVCNIVQLAGLRQKNLWVCAVVLYIGTTRSRPNSMKILLNLLALAALLASPMLLAHHSFAIFDFQKQVPFEGTVEMLKFRNPHIEMKLKVKAADGSEQSIHFIEGAPANMIVRNGIRPEQMAVGSHLRTFGSPLLEDPSKYFLRVIILDDGTEYRN